MKRLLLMSTLLINCHGQQSSDIATLDHFTSGDTQTMNTCRGDHAVILEEGRQAQFYIDAQGEAQSTLREAIKTSLTAVPTYSQRIFKDLGGQIVVTKDAQSICTQGLDAISKAQSSLIESCYALSRSSDGSTKFKFYLTDRPEVIKHSLVKTFGFFHAQFLRDLKLPDTGAPFADDLYKQEISNELKVGLVKSYLTDLLDSQVGLVSQERYLGSHASTILAQNLASQPTSMEEIFAGLSMIPQGDDIRSLTAEQRTQRQKNYMDHILAESYDSYHCEGRGADKRMESQFPETYAYFQENVASKLDQATEGLGRRIQSFTAFETQSEEATYEDDRQQATQGRTDILSRRAPIQTHPPGVWTPAQQRPDSFQRSSFNNRFADSGQTCPAQLGEGQTFESQGCDGPGCGVPGCGGVG